MNYLLAFVVAATALAIGLAWLGDVANQRIVAQAQAQAIITQANAQATAITMAAATPLVVVVLAGLVFLILAIGWTMRQRHKEPQVIERQIVYVLPPGSTRAELWRMMSDHGPEAILPGNFKVKK